MGEGYDLEHCYTLWERFKASLGKLCLGACIYHLWQQRNALVHSSNLRTEETLIKHLKLFSRLCLIRTFFFNKKTLTNGAVAFVL